jgi:hypothetical protein
LNRNPIGIVRTLRLYCLGVQRYWMSSKVLEISGVVPLKFWMLPGMLGLGGVTATAD